MSGDLNRDQFRKNLLKHSRRAFEAIPQMQIPSILDLGCGSGVQTIELAKLSNCHVTAVDIDTTALDKLRRRTMEEGLQEHIDIVEGSIKNLSFLQSTFDIIWAEGSIFVVGFERALRDWGEYLVPGGFLVIHDDSKDRQKKLKMIQQYGYLLIAHFDITHNEWWTDYYEPLEKHIKELKKQGISLEEIDREIEKFTRDGTSSTFFIIQKPTS